MKPQRMSDLLNTQLEVNVNPTNLVRWEKKGYFVSEKDKYRRRKFNASDAVLMQRIIAMETLGLSSAQIKDAIEGNDLSLPGTMLKQMDKCENVLFPILRGWLSAKFTEVNRRQVK